uniref:Putative vacuole protein n=1 Tax=Moniliophthora roreri TaxID=221103 RepID=A0A0W0FIS6_MONRR
MAPRPFRSPSSPSASPKQHPSIARRPSATTSLTSSTVEDVEAASLPNHGARVYPHSQDAIRLNTMQLSEMLLAPPSGTGLSTQPSSFSSEFTSSSGPRDRDTYPSSSSFRTGSISAEMATDYDSDIAVVPRSAPLQTRSNPDVKDNSQAGVRDEADAGTHVEVPRSSTSGDGSHTLLSPFKSGLSILLGNEKPSTSTVPSTEGSLMRSDSTLSAHAVMSSSGSPSSLPEADMNAATQEYRSGSPTPVPTRLHSPTLPDVGTTPEENPSIRVSRPSRPPPISKKSIRWDPKLGPQSRSHSPHTSPSETRSSESISSLFLPLSSPQPPVSSSETTPLLHTPDVSEGGGNGSSPSLYGSIPVPLPKPDLHKLSPGYISSKLFKKLSRRIDSARKLGQADVKQNLLDLGKQSVRALPAVLLGCLLNILDGVSYGMIIFPTSDPFTTLGPMGVSMFFVSTIASQLVYTLGGSGFAGANGSMMIEVVPFFHILAQSIAKQVGEDRPAEVIATTIVAYAISSILTGISFLLLGALKLGVIIGFFPRHILVGCIGGVGVFLIQTGLTVSLRIPDDDFAYNWETFKLMFFNTHKLALWTIPLALAVLLRIITSKWKHQLVFPIYFVIIPVLFYIIVAAAQLNLGELRHAGWLFDAVASANGGGEEEWYKFYTYLHWDLIHVGPLWSTLPTQFALLFFNILHPPLNVPALAVSLNEDVNTNKELVGHGYSNLLSGLLGTVPNYLVYVNTLLFYRVGGGTRVAGFLLAVATGVLLWIGTGPIAFIPVPVVGALIYALGIDLVKEALWDTRHRVSRTEYITIASIMVAMTVWDFVIGVLFGIVISSFFFVVQNSQRRSIRALHTGETSMSTVRRPSSQRAYIKEVSKQTTVLRLQGFLFFGTISYVEETIRSIVEGPSWSKNPVRFLVLDLSLVYGVDMSSAEAFVRIHRLLQLKYVTMVFCGFEADSTIGKALQSVDVLGAEGVELFSDFNDAMEWTENCYLRAWFRSQKEIALPSALPVFPGRESDTHPPLSSVSSVGSPRRSHLREAGSRTIANDIRTPSPLPNNNINPEPYNTLIKVFSSFGHANVEQFQAVIPYLQRLSIPEGYVLWKQDDPPDGLYIIEAGVLRASYRFAKHTQSIEESMVPGTLAGELSALSNLPRNATVIAERPAILWKLTIENLKRLETEEPEVARIFIQMVLKSCKIDYDILLSAVLCRW